MKLLKITFIFAFLFTFISVDAQTEQVDTTNQETFVIVETHPEYPGGNQARLSFLAKKIHYPLDAIESGIQGTVYIQFIVEKDGSVTNAKVIRGVSPSIDKAALKAVKQMPKWKPGTQDGKAVRAQFNMPVKFMLSTDTPKEKELTRKEKRALKKKQKAEAKAKKE